jgi:hypothetical protein
MQKKILLSTVALVVVCVLGYSISYYYTKNKADKVLNYYINEYQFPKNKVDTQKIYRPKVADTFSKEVHIKGNKEDYYIFSYDTEAKKVDLTGVVEGGEWLDLKDHRYKLLPYQPSKKFLKIYYHQ